MAAKSKGKSVAEPPLRVVSDRTEAPKIEDITGKPGKARRGYATALRWVVPMIVLAAAAYAAWTYLGRSPGYAYTTAPVTRIKLVGGIVVAIGLVLAITGFVTIGLARRRPLPAAIARPPRA